MPAVQALRSTLDDDARALSGWARARGTTGAAAVAARADRSVAVVGSGRIGGVVVDVLASSGVGTVLLDDVREVRPGDVGVGGLRERDVGRRRDDALGELVAHRYSGFRVCGPSHDAPDLVVLVVEERLATLRTARLVSEGVPHLVVTVAGWGARVGPFVVPGETACVRCVDLHEADAERRWGDDISVAPALGGETSDDDAGGEPGSRGDAGGTDALGARPEDGAPADHDGTGLPVLVPQSSTVAATAGALVGADVVAYLDGRRPATAGASIEVETLDAMPRLRGWSVHPRCGCTGMGDGPPAV